MTTLAVSPAVERIDAWRAELADQTIIAARKVQVWLFDLYGDLDGHPVQERVKSWLTLSVERQVFEAAELRDFLVGLRNELS